MVRCCARYFVSFRAICPSRRAFYPRRASARDVGSCLGLAAREENAGAKQPRALQELLQQRFAFGPKQKIRDVAVLPADLPFVFVEAAGGRPENPEIDIDQNPGITAGRHGVVPRRHDQAVHPLCGGAHLACGALCEEARARPIRASRLIVVSRDVVDGVVKPERELDLRGELGKRAELAEMLQAFGEMLQRVIFAMRLAVAHDQFAE